MPWADATASVLSHAMQRGSLVFDVGAMRETASGGVACFRAARARRALPPLGCARRPRGALDRGGAPRGHDRRGPRERRLGGARARERGSFGARGRRAAEGGGAAERGHRGSHARGGRRAGRDSRAKAGHGAGGDLTRDPEGRPRGLSASGQGGGGLPRSHAGEAPGRCGRSRRGRAARPGRIHRRSADRQRLRGPGGGAGHPAHGPRARGDHPRERARDRARRGDPGTRSAHHTRGLRRRRRGLSRGHVAPGASHRRGRWQADARGRSRPAHDAPQKPAARVRARRGRAVRPLDSNGCAEARGPRRAGSKHPVREAGGGRLGCRTRGRAISPRAARRSGGRCDAARGTATPRGRRPPAFRAPRGRRPGRPRATGP